MPTLADNPLRHAAVFIRTLDADSAATMLSRLSADEAKRLRAAIRELGEVDPEERQRVAAEWDGSQAPGPEPTTLDLTAGEGVELDLSSAAIDSPLVDAPAPAIESDAAKPDALEWLRTIEDADPRAIAEYLAGEQPSAVAVVLAHLPAQAAAGVLQCYSPAEQTELLALLAVQDEADPDSVRVLASGLTEWVQQQRERSERRTSRLSAIREILAATPDSARTRLQRQLAESVPEIKPTLLTRPLTKPASSPPAIALPLAEPPLPAATAPSIPFDELARVDGRALTLALAELDPRAALLALAAAPRELLDRVTEGLPRAAGRDLRRRINRVGPTTLTEIDRAQLALAEAVGRIVERRRREQPTNQPMRA